MCRSTQSIMLKSKIPGEFPPPAPRACFGRGEIIEEIIGRAENLEPIALIGAGGIGKTAIALMALHHNRVKQRFGENRRFIRCDQFPATLSHFLSRLSKVIGAGVENPENLTSLLPSLSSKEMLIVLDNAESILDPQGADAREIYTSVEALCRLDTISLCITSRISAVPPDCETLDIPTLSMESARDAFYRIYKRSEGSNAADDILKQLDFHPLSITLFATVAHQNKWDTGRLISEWEGRRTGALETEHQTSLGTTIELSLASPLFKELGPDARGLLGVVAFYPQGVDEKNLDWLFSTVPDVTRIFDKLCILSLTYRINGFFTMLAPLRDHLCPKDPQSSLLLCTTKERYFTRMTIDFEPHKPGFDDTRWIVSEDVNVEHLLDMFTSIDPDSKDIWNTCIKFLRHLEWHKPRRVVLGPKIEALPDNHHSKLECLLVLSTISGGIGNFTEELRLLNSILELGREQNNDDCVVITLEHLSSASRMSGLYEEGIRWAKEALEVYERLGYTADGARCLEELARSLYNGGQLEAAEEAAVRSIQILSENGGEYQLCQSNRTLGDIYGLKGEREKSIHHFEVALGIASSFSWDAHLCWTHLSLAELFLSEDKFDDAYIHTKQAKSHALDDPYYLGRIALLQATISFRQHSLDDATSEYSRAIEIFEKLGSPRELEICRDGLQSIEREKISEASSSRLDSIGELIEGFLSDIPLLDCLEDTLVLWLASYSPTLWCILGSTLLLFHYLFMLL